MLKTDFLVVVEMSMTDTASFADVILPASSFAEKDGTFINCERRVQRVRKAIEPIGDSLPDWQIMAKLAHRFGYQGFEWRNAEEVFNEFSALMPIYSGMSYPRIEQHGGLQWPCNTHAPDGSAILHRKGFPNGKARLIPLHHLHRKPLMSILYLTTIRLHFHYGCGSMTRKSPTRA